MNTIPPPFFINSNSNNISNMARFSILLVLATCLFITPSFSELCNPKDKQTLLQIKRELGNPTSLSSWLPTTDCCNPTWPGLLCDTKAHRVDILELSYFNLNLTKPYPIPPSIGNLRYLQLLSLTRIPNFIGPIPPSFAKLTNLHYLTISHTNVSGNIPEFFSKITNLITLDFSYNTLSGNLPASLSILSNLTAITFHGNRLSGPIPHSYGSFSNQFTSLMLSRNRLSGNIPATLAKLNLAFVDLSQNMLEGDASMLFGTRKNTQNIILANNFLSFDMGKLRLTKNLQGLDLRNNRIYGTLPRRLAALKNLHALNVSYNNLCGEIPRGGKLHRFDVSSYAHNKCLCGSPLPPCKA